MFIQYVVQFFLQNKKIWCRGPEGKHWIVPDRDKRWELVRTVYEDLEHKRIFTVWAWLLDQFWWPSLTEDVKYFIQTCHACQTQ